MRPGATFGRNQKRLDQLDINFCFPGDPIQAFRASLENNVGMIRKVGWLGSGLSLSTIRIFCTGEGAYVT